MADLQTLRSIFYSLTSQADPTSSVYQPAEVAGLLNNAAEFVASITRPPVDVITIDPESGKNVYTLPTDTMLVNQVFFGNPSIGGDVSPELTFMPFPAFTAWCPNWADTNSKNYGRPQAWSRPDRHSIIVEPTISSDYVTNYKFFIHYGYLPQAMTQDTDQPDIEAGFHALLPKYAAHLAYLGKFSKPELAQLMYTEFLKDIQLVKNNLQQDCALGGFVWGTDIVDLSGTITNLPDLRI